MDEQRLYQIHYLDGSHVQLAGRNFTDAYRQNQRKTIDGQNISFDILDFYFRVPVPMAGGNTFQILLKKDEKSDLRAFGSPFEKFEDAENIMKTKIRKEDYFYGVVVDALGIVSFDSIR